MNSLNYSLVGSILCSAVISSLKAREFRKRSHTNSPALNYFLINTIHSVALGTFLYCASLFFPLKQSISLGLLALPTAISLSVDGCNYLAQKNYFPKKISIIHQNFAWITDILGCILSIGIVIGLGRQAKQFPFMFGLSVFAISLNLLHGYGSYQESK